MNVVLSYNNILPTGSFTFSTNRVTNLKKNFDLKNQIEKKIAPKISCLEMLKFIKSKYSFDRPYLRVLPPLRSRFDGASSIWCKVLGVICIWGWDGWHLLIESLHLCKYLTSAVWNKELNYFENVFGRYVISADFLWFWGETICSIYIIVNH